MLCLVKLQKEAAKFLNRDLKSLVSVDEALKNAGYTHIVKANEKLKLDDFFSKYFTKDESGVLEAKSAEQIKDFEALEKTKAESLKEGEQKHKLEIQAKEGKLNANELLEKLKKLDLSSETNAFKKEKIIISSVDEEEALQLQKEFNFKNKKPLVREIDTHQIIHTLKQHSNPEKEAKRGQIAVDLNDIANYESITKDYNLRLVHNNKILYAKQVNGYFVVLEEVLQGQDKLRFFDLWKGQGKINKEVLLSHSQRPNTNSSLNLESQMITTEDIIPKNPTTLQANQHIGAGLAAGAINGIEQDEEGNIIFNPESFVKGFLAGAGGSVALSKGYKKFLEKYPERIIPFINAKKPQKLKDFEITKELEKTYRNAEIIPSEIIKNTLALNGVIKGDFIKLAQKHPEYFTSPQEAKLLCDYVFLHAHLALKASDKKQALIIAKLQDVKNNYGAVAFRIENINGEHRVRSVFFMDEKQVNFKIQKAKRQESQSSISGKR